MRHLPEIRYDAFDVTSRAMSVGRKPPTDMFRPVTATLEAGKGRNQGQRPWLPRHRYFQCIKSWHTISLLHIEPIFRDRESRKFGFLNLEKKTIGNFPKIFTTRKRSLGQGNIFAPVCHSVHRGSTWAGTHPQAGIPPLGRYTPWAGTPPQSVHAGIWSTSRQYASTGMHSFYCPQTKFGAR